MSGGTAGSAATGSVPREWRRCAAASTRSGRPSWRTSRRRGHRHARTRLRERKERMMTIDKTVLVPLDANETFALLTEPERLRRWQLVSARMDLRAGGDFRWTVVPGANASGTFVEVEPGKRLVYTWGWETERTAGMG